ncbi:MAG: aminomethyl-transferring glycine dehydrogenase subunit GcvPB [Planctomycetes bacterium]|nr:aminomethyl-transferring glycine dehydrogenase subunit GcvPB [Planctomycetota bacterium]
MSFFVNTPDQVRSMLDAIGVSSIEDLFASIPEPLRRREPLALPPGLSEMELRRQMGRLAAQNARADDRPCFLGGGAYRRFIPAAVDLLSSRGEFFTAYTPYQAETSQGTLQAIFEYQAMVVRLTGMEIANASLYDGATAVSEAVSMALAVREESAGRRVVVSRGVHPEWRDVLRTMLTPRGVEIAEVPLEDGATAPDEAARALAAGDAFALVFQSPNFFGRLEDGGALVRAAHDAGTLAIAAADPISLGILEAPGAWGADVVVGDGQPLGNPLAYGGPTFGILATRMANVRKLPGRIVGQTVDREGRRGFVLTFQPREQHIRREKATSNICTNESLCALRAAIYLSLLGPAGLREVAEASARAAHHLADRLAAETGIRRAHRGPFFDEFAVDLPVTARAWSRALAGRGILGGLDLGRFDPADANRSLLCATELTTDEEIDALIAAARDLAPNTVAPAPRLAARPQRTPVPPPPPPPPSKAPAEAPDGAPAPTVFERSRPGRRSVVLPAPLGPGGAIEGILPAEAIRRAPPPLPELAEADVVRHYTKLSTLNVGVDSCFYPLGSCTMKYNPRAAETIAALPGFRDVHPYQDDDEVQGLLQVLHEVAETLAEVSGLPHLSLQPAAGAHGEVTALLMIRAHLRSRGSAKDVILIPDSAHGTNPASAVLAGFRVRQVRSSPEGTIDWNDFQAKLDDDVAGIMITNPNTLGIFEPDVARIATALRERGAFTYMDGANMNALLGIARPGDFGVDVMHFNLHKTFATPHGGGGPGAGPIAAGDRLRDVLPSPRLVRDGDRYRWESGSAPSIGRVRGFHGNVGIIVRAYAYIRSHGPEALRQVSEHAVLGANYIRARLRDAYDLPYDRPSLHEVVFSASRQKKRGIHAFDIAKRLIDLGFHPPTIYFPLIVDEALMIEPTETEGQETLDRFIEAMRRIAREAVEEPDRLHEAPVTKSVRRLDEVRAVRSPCLSC